MQAAPPVTAEQANESDNADPPDVFATASSREWLTAIAWMASFFLLLWLVGALIAVPLFAVAYLITAARSRIVLAGVYALASGCSSTGSSIARCEYPFRPAFCSCHEAPHSVDGQP